MATPYTQQQLDTGQKALQRMLTRAVPAWSEDVRLLR
jgi:hypothetical protein